MFWHHGCSAKCKHASFASIGQESVKSERSFALCLQAPGSEKCVQCTQERRRHQAQPSNVWRMAIVYKCCALANPKQHRVPTRRQQIGHSCVIQCTEKHELQVRNSSPMQHVQCHQTDNRHCFTYNMSIHQTIDRHYFTYNMSDSIRQTIDIASPTTCPSIRQYTLRQQRMRLLEGALVECVVLNTCTDGGREIWQDYSIILCIHYVQIPTFEGMVTRSVWMTRPFEEHTTRISRSSVSMN